VKDEARITQFWKGYTESARVNCGEFRTSSFGDTPKLADELLNLVIAGTKRATTSLPRDYASSGVPKPGDFSIVLDGRGTPRCILRTLDVEIKAMGEVGASFAWDEGEGDRSLAWWRSAHVRYFKRQGARDGFEVDDATMVVLERFEVVWPPEFADRRDALI
jgi:uncharacterized protein YhfF